VIESIADGDTVNVIIDRGHDIKHHRQAIRLRRIDTAESDDRTEWMAALGKLAKTRLEQLLPIGSEQTLLTFKTPKSNREELEKFGRFQGDFAIGGLNVEPLEFRTVCSLLVSERLAVPYRGQNKRDVEAAHRQNYLWQLEQMAGTLRLPTP
jgi:endonuclease YncB( thermonuclease family)